MSKVSMKSTKQEILEVVSQLEAQLKEKREGSKTVVTAQAEKETAERSKNAKEVVDMNILNDSIVKGYNDVMFAIEVAKKELAEIQGVKEAIIDAEAVVMAQQVISKEKETLAQERLTKLTEDAEKVISEKEVKLAELETEYKEKKKNLEKEREREAEEFAYKLKRDRKIENDKWEDEKSARERDLEEKEENLTERTNNLYLQENELKDLRLAVDELPGLVLKAKEEGKLEAEKQLAKEKAIETASVKKNAEWEIKVANMEKERAIQDLAKANTKIESLEAKLEAAYASMNTLATTTVQSTGGVKILETGKDK